MGTADLQRGGRFLQIQTIIDHGLWVARTPPPCNWEALGFQKPRGDVHPADTISSLCPLVSAENQEIYAAVNHVDGKHSHPLGGVDNKNQVAFPAQSAQCNEILSEASCELDVARHEHACFRCDASLNVRQVNDAAI